MSEPSPSAALSLTEWAVLGVLAEHRAHPFAIARDFEPESELGRVLTVRRPLVYRALDRLVAGGLAEPIRTERGDAGPRRTVHRITADGRRRLEAWLRTPVSHVRDLRLGFLVKITLLQRSRLPIAALVTGQLDALAATFVALETPAGDDHVADRWRRHQAAAARAFLADLAAER